MTAFKYLMELTAHGSQATTQKFFEKWMLLVVSFKGINAFLPIWILFPLDFYCYILSNGYRDRKFQRIVSESFIKQNRPTLNKHATSLPLKSFN